MGRTLLRGICVAGIRIVIESPPALPWDLPEGPLTRFRVPAHDPDAVIGVRVGIPEAPAQQSVHYDSEGGIFDVAREGDDWVFALRVRGELQRVARFDAAFRTGEVVVHPESFYAREAHYPLAYPLDELLVFHRLALQGNLLIHACGVVRDGRALLFTGPSGAGKTTIARRMLEVGGCSVLSDDRIAIRADADGFRVHGTPWHGDAPLSRADSARLAGIYAIHQTRTLAPLALSGVEAATAVLGNAFVPIHDRVAAARILELAEQLVNQVPITRLGCPNDASVVDYVWGHPARASAA